MTNDTTWTAVDLLKEIHFMTMGVAHFTLDSSGKFSPAQDAMVRSLAGGQIPSATGGLPACWDCYNVCNSAAILCKFKIFIYVNLLQWQ